MTLSPTDFKVEDINDFADFLGLNGVDGDLFYESYYRLNVDDQWDEDDYRESDHYQTY